MPEYSRMARRHRRTQHKRRHRRQQGGGWGFTGSAFAPAGGMAPEAARALTDDCATLDRPAPSVTPTGAWSQAGGGCGSCAGGVMPPQVGGDMFGWLFGKKEDKPASTGPTSGTDDSGVVPNEAVPISSVGGTGAPESTSPGVGIPGASGNPAGAPLIQEGGGGGGGGYGFVLDNTMGKVYGDLHVGACPQRGGGDPLVSHSAGYGFGTSSAEEVGGGTAHFLTPISYGKQCMGGGRRKTRRGRKGRKARRSHRRHH
jgi:hypothetical protein